MENSCYLLIANYSGTEIVLGTLFQTQFYMEYDYEKGRIGLARAVKSVPVRENSREGLLWWGWVMASLLIICTIGFFYLLYRLFKPNRKQKLRKNSLNEREMLKSIKTTESRGDV